MTVGLYYSKALELIREKGKGIINQTLKTHFERYEELYQWFKDNGYSKIALKALERKERLVGLHDGEMVMVEEAVVGLGTFSWVRLSSVERERVMALVKKVVKVVKTEKNDI